LQKEINSEDFMKKSILLLMVVLVSLFLHPGSSMADDILSLNMRNATVKIFTVFIHPNYNDPWKVSKPHQKTGSGVIIDGNRILTNAHVVSDATNIQVQRENDPERYAAKVLYVGHDCDLALVSVNDKSFFRGRTPVKLGNVPKLQSTVVTYGYPQGGERISITTGVVSRLEIGSYSHSDKEKFLRIQTDAALNHGNSGGPVIQNGKIAGIAFQVIQKADNIGYFIPVPIIQHFLHDVKDGTFDGFPSLGILHQDLMSKSFRRYVKLPKNLNGIYVSRILKGGSAWGKLRKGDVITAIDGLSVANDGSISTPHGRLDFSYMVTNKQMGERVRLKIFRTGRSRTVTLKLRPYTVIIPWYEEYETRPEYYIFGGIIFQKLSREYLQTWKEWWYNADRRMLYYYYNHIADDISPKRKEFIVINKVLPDKANTYISRISEEVVREINGITINSFEDVVTAFKKPQGAFHKIYVDGSNYPILLRVDEMKEANRRIMRNYQIPSLWRFNKNRNIR
jgi:S1-C subfamily serine protease